VIQVWFDFEDQRVNKAVRGRTALHSASREMRL